MASIPLKIVSQLGLLFPIYGKIENVPNHKPESINQAANQSIYQPIERVNIRVNR